VHQTRVVELLTKHATTVFGPPESLMSGGGRGQGWEGRRRGRQGNSGNNDTERQPGQELRIGSFSDEDQDNENEQPIPDFLLPDYSQKVKKSPLLNRASSPPKIIKSSLKNFSGLEGVRTNQLSAQDSVDSSHSHSKQRQSHISHPPTVPESPDGIGAPGPPLAQSEFHGERDRTSVTSSIVSINEENKVKIQVPGLPIIKTTKPDKGDVTEH